MLRSREENTAVQRRALGELCAAYRYPLYVFLRRSGRRTEEAQELTQDFLRG